MAVDLAVDIAVEPAAARPSTPKVAGSNGHQAPSGISRQRRTGRTAGVLPVLIRSRFH